MAMGSSRDKRAISEPNVTPLVDVMMVLLVVFMLMAPIMMQAKKPRQEVGVDLPRTDAKDVQLEDKRKLILTIRSDFKLLVGEAEVADCSKEASLEYPLEEGGCMSQLEEKLVGNVKLQRDKEIYLLADRRIPYGLVVSAMARIRKAGVERLGMVTDPPGGLDDEKGKGSP